MITSISLHPSQQDELNNVQINLLRKSAVNDFPYPLAVSFNNFYEASNKKNNLLALTLFVSDITTSVFHFFSLVLVSEYIESKAPRTLNLYQAIENMTYRPGPGKWLAFLREFYHHQKANGETLGAFPEMLEFVEKNEIKKQSAYLVVEENQGDSPAKKLGLLELMVNLRNSFAHSKGYDEESLAAIFESAIRIVDLLCLELSFLKDYQLVLKPHETKDDVILKGVSLPPQVINEPTGQILRIVRENHHTHLSPLIISDECRQPKPQDIFLLESIDNKKVFFAATRTSVERRIDKDELAIQAVKALKSIYVEPEILSTDRLNWNQFRSRVADHSSHTLHEYELNGKYNEQVYVLPGSAAELLQSFNESDKKILFLHDDQGGGKSAFCAYLTDRFIKSQEPERAVFLLDARCLDELGEDAMLFDAFMKKKLGLSGNLEDFFRGCQKKQPDFKFTIVIDNLNEYFLKGRDQAYLMDRLFDLLHRWKEYSNIRFIATARHEYFTKSIEKYHQAYKDKNIEALTHRPYYDKEGKARITTPLPPLSENELAQIWANYSTRYTGCSPKTGWEKLNPHIKKHCDKPLIILFLLRHYDNRQIPAKLSMDDIKSKYIRGVLDEKALRNTLFGFVKLMFQQKRPYLLTEDLDEKQMREIADSSKDPKTMLPFNSHYSKLVDMQLIREEKVIKGDLLGKKISVNNEMTLDLINQEFSNYKRKAGLQFSIALMISFVVLLPVLAGILLFEPYRTIQELPNILIQIVDNYSLFDTLTDQTHSALLNIIHNNYVFSFVVSLFTSSLLLFSLIFLAILVLSFMFEYYLGKKKGKALADKRFNFFEILQFHELSKAIHKKFIKLTVYASIGFVVTLIGLLLFSSILENFNHLIILFSGFLLSLIIAAGLLAYKALLKEDKEYERYFININYRDAKKSLKNFIISVSMIVVTLCFAPVFVNMVTAQINKNYSEKFMKDISALKQVASKQEIDDLIYFFDNHDFIYRIDVEFNNISKGLRQENVDFIDSLNQLEVLEESNPIKLGDEMRLLVTNNWCLWVLIIFGIPIVLIASLIEIPLRLAREKRPGKKILV